MTCERTAVQWLCKLASRACKVAYLSKLMCASADRLTVGVMVNYIIIS